MIVYSDRFNAERLIVVEKKVEAPYFFPGQRVLYVVHDPPC